MNKTLYHSPESLITLPLNKGYRCWIDLLVCVLNNGTGAWLLLETDLCNNQHTTATMSEHSTSLFLMFEDVCTACSIYSSCINYVTFDTVCQNLSFLLQLSNVFIQIKAINMVPKF